MANALYDKYREDCLTRNAGTSSPIDIDTDTISIALCKGGYTANLSTDQYMTTPAAQIPSSTWRTGASGVSGVTCTAGVFNHTAKTLTSVAADSGNAATRILYYKYNAADASAPLIAYIDTFTPGNSVIPNGGDITVTPDAGANKVFKL